MKAMLALPFLLSVLALAATGCGGGNSVADAYANGVCTAIGSWVTTVKPLASGRRGEITQASVEAKLKDFETATKHLASRLKVVPAPNTSGAEATKKEIDLLATEIGRTAADVKVAAANVGKNASRSQMSSALEALASQFQVLRTTAQATLASLESAGGSLAGALRGSNACKQLG
jgi:hypothetical protein